MKTLKMSNGVHTIECIELVRNVWEREGFVEVTTSTISSDSEEMSYQELKSLAKEKGINTHGMKKEEIISAVESIK